MQELQFDYISMVRTCNRFLTVVRVGIRQLRPEPEYQHRSVPDFLSGALSHDHALNLMVMDILNEMDSTWEAGLEMNRGLNKSEKWELAKGSPQMSVVAGVLENFVDKLQDEEEKANKAFRQKNLADRSSEMLTVLRSASAHMRKSTTSLVR